MNQDQAKRCGRDMVMFGNIEDYDIETIVSILQHADDMYYNGDGSFLNDSDYDAIRHYANHQQPHHPYFTGIGSEVRGGKINLPYTMGSLDQVDQIVDVDRWIKNNKLSNEQLVITEKLDGTSAMVIYNHKGELQIAYSRGDGKRGADITRHIKHIVPNKIDSNNQPMVIRGEVIIPEESFPALRDSVKTRAGEQYKNPRNMVAGLMNATRNEKHVYQHIHFVAYDILNHNMDKIKQLKMLENQLDMNTPLWFPVAKGSDITSKGTADLTAMLNSCRDQTIYEIDGIVVDVNGQWIRNALEPGSDDLNPGYAVKYKVADASNLAEAKVIDVDLKVSKHGYIKPVIRIEAVDLAGVTVTKCTGFNMKYIHENKIQPGCTIKITRSGDVIPLCLGVVNPGPLK